MSSPGFHGGLIALGLLLSCRFGLAIDAASPSGAASPAATGTTDVIAPAPPAPMALPANEDSGAGDAGAARKFYTITASLRETYDSNVNTTNINPQASWETSLSPSILVDFPDANSDFSGRYTFGATYYSSGSPDKDNFGGGGNGGSIETTHEFVAQYTHSFSERFNLNLAEQFRYFTEPSLFESTGTAYRNGPYISNAINGTVNARWTPLFSTTTTYANTVVKYEQSAVALYQNSIENTGSQIVSFALLPKISLNFGGIADDIDYENIDRGYTSYTGFFGAEWQVLPSLSVTGRGGGTYTEAVGPLSQTMISPYVALSINWTLGARSMLSFDYAHEITPSEEIGANGQTSDRFTGSFRYDITASLSSHLQGIFTKANISGLQTSGGLGFNENEYGLDTGLTYHYNSYLDLNGGISLSGVSSNIASFDYTREQAYVGIRGTY